MTDGHLRTGLLQELLREGIEDWISESDIAGRIFFEVVGSPSDRRAVALGLIAEALLGDFMIAGSLGDQGFVPWPEDPGSSLLRIAKRWLELDPLEVYPGKICWLCNTAKGDAIGRTT